MGCDGSYAEREDRDYTRRSERGSAGAPHGLTVMRYVLFGHQ
jgi:hypothetical protein